MTPLSAQRLRLSPGLLASLAAALAAASGCALATQRELARYDAAFESGLYAEAREQAAGLAAEGDSDNAPLWHLDAGGAAALLGDAPGAIAELDAAEDAFRDRMTRSGAADAAEGVATVVWSDNASVYAATGLERMWCNLEKGFLNAADGRPDRALVEFNRALQRQRDYLADEQAAFERELREQSDSAFSSVPTAALAACGADPDSYASPAFRTAAHFTNPYLLHAAGVFRWLYGTGGEDCLLQAARLYPGVSLFADDLARSRSGASPDGWVWVYVEDGLCPVLRETRLDLNVVTFALSSRPTAMPVIALPALRRRGPAHLGYSVDGVALEPVADVEDLLAREFSRGFRAILAREPARTVAKAAAGVAVDVLTRPSDRHDDSGEAVNLAANLLMLVFQESSAGADLRRWTSLPRTVWAARIRRPAGGRLVLRASDGASYAADVPAAPAIVRFRIPAAGIPAAASVIPFPRPAAAGATTNLQHTKKEKSK